MSLAVENLRSSRDLDRANRRQAGNTGLVSSEVRGFPWSKCCQDGDLDASKIEESKGLEMVQLALEIHVIPEIVFRCDSRTTQIPYRSVGRTSH